MRSMLLVGLLLAVPAPALAQAPDLPRTPWGAPDLSGYWEYRSTTPLERPEALAGREVLTAAEEAEYLAGRHAAIRRERDLQLNADWWQPGGLTDGRTSLIVDPPDGRLPPRTPAGRERARTLGIAIRLRSADGPEDRERYERCIMGRTVPLLAVSPNRLAQIFQTPDHVAILHEQNSDLRIIPLDGRPRLPARIRQWQGNSRGRWEGDTLVVETVGFNGEWTIRGTGSNARYVERFRLAAADALHYEFTAHDPASFTGPWTVMFPITRAAGPVYENACHEGNYSLPLILSGARAEERGRR